MGENDVFINDFDVIEIIVTGDQTVESVQAMGDEVARLVKLQRKHGKPTLVMDNVLHMGKVPADARRLVVELAKLISYQKLAMVGNGTVIKMGSNLMLQAIGKGSKLKYFDDYDAAIEWLTAK